MACPLRTTVGILVSQVPNSSVMAIVSMLNPVANT